MPPMAKLPSPELSGWWGLSEKAQKQKSVGKESTRDKDNVVSAFLCHQVKKIMQR